MTRKAVQDFSALIDAGNEQPVLEPDEIVAPAPKPEATGVVTYESRIRILDAWQYPGQIPREAPEWIDRNWVGWQDIDPLRDLPAGPCLRVPLATGELAICRIGDYVCRQEMLMIKDFPGDMRIEVWPGPQFEKLFLPVRQTSEARLDVRSTA